MNSIDKSRRKTLLTLGLALAFLPASKLLHAAEMLNINAKTLGNFQYIYGNPSHKKEFYSFLINVFHLYPEDKMHEMITLLSKRSGNDEVIYTKGQRNLSGIKPFLADFSYALPALSKQKKIIAEQTSNLLGDRKRFTGYLEVGSNGRYLDTLENNLNIDGDIFFLSETSASYSPTDIIDRGQLFRAGKDLKLDNYKSNLNKHIPKKSIDLITVYIGLHHCPLHLREEFITSLRESMADNGVLIIRDHNAHNEKMQKMIALAHDVFNMGTRQTWRYNADELRHFYSLATLDHMLKKYGFKSDGRKLYQKGDPTLNALMSYQKA